MLQKIQSEREEKLVRNLLDRIERYVRGDKVGFVEWAREAREKLKYAGNL